MDPLAGLSLIGDYNAALVLLVVLETEQWRPVRRWSEASQQVFEDHLPRAIGSGAVTALSQLCPSSVT